MVVARYVCPTCGLVMTTVTKVTVKHYNGKCYLADLYTCRENCNRFLFIKEEVECGNREFRFSGYGEFSILYDLDEISWI